MKKDKDDSYFINKMSKFGKLMWYSYTIEIFRDGDGASYTHNKWNPLTYILWGVAILSVFIETGTDGLKEEWKYNQCGWKLTGYWKKPENVMRYISRY